jgi:hypothetical protein
VITLGLIILILHGNRRSLDGSQGNALIEDRGGSVTGLQTDRRQRGILLFFLACKITCQNLVLYVVGGCSAVSSDL